ncbi:hypothetical protein HC928_15465 [bacterium]|nr:hypothetical protein [bacterium]
MIAYLARTTDHLEHFWEQQVMKRAAGSILVLTYVVTILLIELNRQGWLPDPFAGALPRNHFFAVEIAFTVLLFTEVVSLVFGLTRSFSRSIGIQLEILCLILLRDTFKQFTYFSEPLEWEQVVDSIGPMIVDALGALSIFLIIASYYRVQKGRPITDDEQDQLQFINYKKVIALGLLGVFALIGIVDLYRLATDQPIYPFFETFYTVLIFTDVLMVLLSLRYSITFAVTFRNFGYAIVTVFIRLALIAPTLIGVLMGIGTALFALGLTVAYNMSLDTMLRQGMKPRTDHQPPPERTPSLSRMRRWTRRAAGCWPPAAD